MGLNFRKRIKLGKLVNLNIGKSGVGVSIGIPGARLSINSKGKSTATVGLPGTGIYYTKSLNNKAKRKAAKTVNLTDVNQSLINYQEALFALSHIHNQANDFIDFDSSPIQYQTSEMGPRQKQAIEQLENYKPSFFDKLLNKSDQKLADLQQKILVAIEEDTKDRKVHVVDGQLEQGLKAHQQQAIEQFLNQVGGFNILEDDVNSYQVRFVANVDEVSSIHLDITINLEQDVLDNQVSLLQSGRLSNKKLTKKDLYQRQEAYLCSLTLAFATQALALTPIELCTINVFNQTLSNATGLVETVCILAGEFDEKQLLNLNYETLNPVQVVSSQSVEYALNERTGFKEITPIQTNPSLQG